MAEDSHDYDRRRRWYYRRIFAVRHSQRGRGDRAARWEAKRHEGEVQDLKESFIALHGWSINGSSSEPQCAAVLGQVSVDAPVVPNANQEATPTFNGDPFPFVLDPFYIGSMRYQQIYAASQFPNGGVVDELRFRRDLRRRI